MAGGEPFDWDGEFFKLKHAFTDPLPYQRPRPVVMSAGVSNKGRDFAAQAADILFTNATELALGKQMTLTEKGGLVNGVGDMPNQHDVLTGSTPDGRAYTDGMDHTCNNWTSNNMGTAQLGHSDKQGGGNSSWNSEHPSRGCSQQSLISTGGAGLLYCFATN